MLGRVISYIKYYLKAKTVYNVHSPFVYDFILDVMDTTKEYYSYPYLEHQRKTLLFNHENIVFIDLGAGNKSGKRKVSEIAKSSLSSIEQCRMLFNLINKYKPNNTIELGTSLGLSTLYMATAYAENTIHTIEGNLSSAEIASNLFNKNEIKNIQSYIGPFDDHLESILEKMAFIDLAFIDGNHSKIPTIAYFELFKSKSNLDTILIFDDIYWSKGMNEAWDYIKADPKVTLTIDLYEIGIVFFNAKLSKENITLIDFWKKPWKLGIFG